jgi:hypothetical protein
VWLIEGAPDLVQRLTGFPSAPDVVLLDRSESKPFSCPHTTPPLTADLYQMVLHRPVETTAFIRQCRRRGSGRTFTIDFIFSGQRREILTNAGDRQN